MRILSVGPRKEIYRSEGYLRIQNFALWVRSHEVIQLEYLRQEGVFQLFLNLIFSKILLDEMLVLILQAQIEQRKYLIESIILVIKLSSTFGNMLIVAF